MYPFDSVPESFRSDGSSRVVMEIVYAVNDLQIRVSVNKQSLSEQRPHSVPTQPES